MSYEQADGVGGEILPQMNQKLLHHGHMVELGAEALAQVEHAHHGRELFLLLAVFALLQDGSDPHEQVLDVEGFGDIVRSAVAHDVDGCFRGAVAGHDQEIDVQLPLPDLAQEILAVQAGHAQVADDEVMACGRQLAEGVLPVDGQGHGVTCPGQRLLAYFAKSRLVVHDQHMIRSAHLPTPPEESAIRKVYRPEYVIIYVRRLSI